MIMSQYRSALSENPGISSRSPCRIIIRSDPDFSAEDATMRFHLTYEGSLYRSSTKSPRAKHKQEKGKTTSPNQILN